MSFNAQGRTTMSEPDNDIDEALDWLGCEFTCSGCAHENQAPAVKCLLKRACVNDRYARRIDRFFDWNRGLANSYVRHPHFEVRAIAAKHADVFQLPALLDDPDETVRWNAARRLPKRMIMGLRRDPHREVRIRIVSLLDDVEIAPMMGDADYYVRLVVARRIAPSLLARLIHDDEPEVRVVVARRVPIDWLLQMASDPDANVRLEVAKRVAPDLLTRLKDDPDWRVRFEVAMGIPIAQLADLSEDPDALVREAVQGRLTGKLDQGKDAAI
jgi:HEAT repeat protein